MAGYSGSEFVAAGIVTRAASSTLIHYICRMPKIKLRVLDAGEAKSWGTIEIERGSTVGDSLVMQGAEGDVDFVCGSCGTKLITNVSMMYPKRLKNAAVKCPECGNVNAISDKN